MAGGREGLEIFSAAVQGIVLKDYVLGELCAMTERLYNRYCPVWYPIVNCGPCLLEMWVEPVMK